MQILPRRPPDRPAKRVRYQADPFTFLETKQLEDLEINLDIKLNQHRLPILHRGLELVLHHSFLGLLIQSHANTANHTNVARISIGIDPQIDQNISRDLGLASFFGKLRLNGEDQHPRRNSPANSPRSTTDISSRSRPDTRAIARTQTGPAAIAHR